MKSPWNFNIVLGLLMVVVVCGCDTTSDSSMAPRPKRPMPGDSVSPQILLGKRWIQGGPVLISARLQVQRSGEAKPQLLELKEVPYENVPKVTLTFFDEVEKEISQVVDYPLTRDC